MPLPRRTRPLRAALLLLCFSPEACTTVTHSDLAKREDYLASMTLHGAGETGEALRLMHEKEPSGFLATAERGWLGVLSGNPTPEAMTKVSRNLEERKTIRVTREARSYFYKEAEDGYFPAEHEAIAFHIISGLAFAARGQRNEAMVEARRAAIYLQGDFGSQVGFDDPAIRLWLAALWSYGGEWESARVDLRKASDLDPSLTFARRLSEQKTPPRTLALVLVGSGPDLEWQPDFGLSGESAIDTIKFVPGAASVTLKLDGKDLGGGLSTAAWYSRHQERDRAIRQVLNKSRYMVEGIAPAGVAGATMTLGTVMGVVVMATGVAAGGAIIFYTVKGLFLSGLKGELGGLVFAGGLALGGLVALGGIHAGSTIIGSSKDVSGMILDKAFNPTDGYRYMRFLPDRIHLAPFDKELTSSKLTKSGDTGLDPKLVLSSPNEATKVLVYYVPGSDFDMGKAALRSKWRLATQHQDWVMLGAKSSWQEASDACVNLPAGIETKSFRLPTWTEFLNARAGGIADRTRNTRFGARLPASLEVWSRSELNTNDNKCRVISLRDGGEGTVADCDNPRNALCVARVIGKDEKH